MGYLIGEILICLILAALIGAVVAWFLRGVRSRARENELLDELKQTHGKLDTAEGELRRQEASLGDLRSELQAQAQVLEDRDEKLSSVEAALAKRDESMAELLSDLAKLRDEKEVEINSLREHIGTLEPLQGQLDDSQTKRNRLQAEIRAATDKMQTEMQQLNAELSAAKSERDAEIERLHGELEKTAQQLRTETAERDTAIERLQHELQVVVLSKADEAADFSKRLEELNRQLAEMETLRGSLHQRDEELVNWQRRFNTLELEKNEEISTLNSKLAHYNRLSEQLSESRVEAESCGRELSSLRAISEQDIRTLRKQLDDLEIRQKVAKVLPAGQLFERPAEADDLKKIRGIGPKLEKTLNRLGITTFAQIGHFTADDIERVSNALDFFPGRIVRDGWIDGAAKEFQKKYGKQLDR